jgi:hypothetical protein
MRRTRRPSFDISPRLAITSPEKQCGKTTLLDVLSCLAWRPMTTGSITAASIFRVVEKVQPTLLIDEADTFLPDNAASTQQRSARTAVSPNATAKWVRPSRVSPLPI